MQVKIYLNASVDPELRSRDIKEALQLLEWAGIIYTVHATNASGLPLRSQINEKKFKLLFLDIGLVQRNLQLETVLMQPQANLILINSGQIAEQFAGQELFSLQDFSLPTHLYFWARDKKSSSAEVDFVIALKNKIFPVEVKAGKTGRLKSLNIFIQEKASTLGIKISQEPLNLQNQILTVPFYLVPQIPRLANLLITQSSTLADSTILA